MGQTCRQTRSHLICIFRVDLQHGACSSGKAGIEGGEEAFEPSPGVRTLPVLCPMCQSERPWQSNETMHDQHRASLSDRFGSRRPSTFSASCCCCVDMTIQAC